MQRLEKAVETREFLSEVKRIIPKGFDLVDRRENLEELASLGITKRDCRQIVLSLSVEDYCKGPENDRDRPGYVWTFGHRLEGEDIYIKLKIIKVEEEEMVKCISFHKAKHPLEYPFK